MNRMRIPIVATAALLFTSMPLLAQFTKLDVDPDAPFTHEPSGAVFPARVESFQRTEVGHYDDEGHDLSAGYNQRAPRIAVTVYVYPAREGFDGHFADTEKQISRAHRDVKRVEQREWNLKQGDREFAGRRAKYILGSFGGRGGEAVSELYLLQVGDWFVKYRISYPATSSASAEKVIPLLQQAVTLPAE